MTRGSWPAAAVLAAGFVVVLVVLFRSALADDGVPRESAAEQPAGSDPAPAGTPGRADEPGPAQLPARPVSVRPKMDGGLAAVAETAATAGESAALSLAEARGLVVVGGAMRVLVECTSTDLTHAEAAIIAAGGTVEGAYADTIQALIPPAGLDIVAASPDVRYVRAPAPVVPNRAPAPGRAP